MVSFDLNDISKIPTTTPTFSIMPGIFTIGPGIVENVGFAVRIMVILHSFPAKHSTSGFQATILNCTTKSMSGNIGTVTIGSGIMENVRVVVRIAVISHSVPGKHCTSGFQSAILNWGRGVQWTMSAVSPLGCAWSKKWG